MKITKKLVLLIAFIFALVLTVSSALAAVESVSGETLAELDSNTYQLEGKDYEVTLTLVNSNSKAKFEVNGESTTKLLAGNSYTFSNGATITAADVTYDTVNGSSAEFDLSTPVLDITEIQVGKTGGVLVSYENGEETAGFQPGDEVTLKVKVSNNDDTAIVEGVTVKPTANVDAALTGFPQTEESLQSLNPEQENEVEYTYTIPVNMVSGNYLVEFETNGDEYQSPNSYVSTQNVLLKVEQLYDNVYVDNVTYDNELSCTEKQNNQYTQIEVELINNGQETLTEVRVDLVSGGQILDSKVETIEIESNNPNNPIVIFSTVSNDFVGDKSFTVKVYREAQYNQLLLYDQQTVTLNGEDCTLSISSSSPGNSVSLGTNDMETLSVTVNNPGAVPYSLEWFVYDGVNNVDQNQNSNQFTFGPAAEDQYMVKVVLYDGNNVEVDNNEWTVNVADIPAEFEVSEVYFEGVAKDTTVQTSFTVKNIGNGELTNVTAEFLNVDSEYNAQWITAVPSSLNGGQQETLELQIEVPADESSGKHSIGTLKFSGLDGNNQLVTKEAQIFVQPKSFLTIKKIDFDDIKLGEDFEVEVTIKNDYTEDMDDVEITVRIMDGNTEIAEESEKDIKLKDGKDEDFKFTFDLSDEDLDEDEYTLEVTVEGKADDDTEHYAEEEETVKVDRTKHQIIIKDAKVSPNLLQCSGNRQITVEVEIENVGESDEDDVEIRVKNSDLKMDLKRSNLDLDDFSGSDNDYSTTFNFLVTGAVKSGKHPITIQVFSDGDLEDTEELEIDILDCLTAGSDTGSVNNLGDYSADLQNKLAEYVRAKEQSTVKGSFRESDTYTLLLGVLVVLAFIAALLTVAVLIVKKR